MNLKWLIRLLVQFAVGGAVLMVANRLLPSSASAGVADFKLVGVLLTVFSGVLMLVDLFWPLVSRKLDEPFDANSPLTAREKSRWREVALKAEHDLLINFFATVLLKAMVLAIGASLLAGLIPLAFCFRAAQIGSCLLGAALPTVFLMPAAYLSARRAKIELAAFEEEQAERSKALQDLSSAPTNDFQSDPHYANFGGIITPKP